MTYFYKPPVTQPNRKKCSICGTEHYRPHPYCYDCHVYYMSRWKVRRLNLHSVEKEELYVAKGVGGVEGQAAERLLEASEALERRGYEVRFVEEKDPEGAPLIHLLCRLPTSTDQSSGV